MLVLSSRAALILHFADTSSIKYYCLMYSQVQVPIPIHGCTTECVVKIYFVFVIGALQLKKLFHGL